LPALAQPNEPQRESLALHATGGRMTGYIYLAIAITAEVIATTSMKALDGFSRPLPLLLVVVGYSISFWMLSLVVKTIPVGIAYAVWAGLGIVLVSIAAALIYQQKLDPPAILGMALIVAGVVVIQLFSGSTGH
jgi:small multidrug resistance pump